MRCGSEGRLPDRNGKCWMSELRFSWMDTNGRACGIFCLRRSSVVKIQTSWPFPLPRFFDGRRDAGLIRRSFRLQIFIGLCVGRVGAIESNGEEGAALPCRWREKLTDEELNGLGERACPRAPSGAPRARHIENSNGLRPHFFQLSPRGRVLVHPGAGALPETMALSRLWRGGDERLGWRGSGFTGRIRVPTAVGITGCLLKVYLRAGFALCPAARLAVGCALRGSMNLLGVKNDNLLS